MTKKTSEKREKINHKEKAAAMLESVEKAAQSSTQRSVRIAQLLRESVEKDSPRRANQYVEELIADSRKKYVKAFSEMKSILEAWIKAKKYEM